MSTDAHFLAAVAAAPLDSLPKLVYADWLDERGDVRGELIRLEEETRERVAWDETLWKLKPRRNELRKQVSADWLQAMDYGRHCEPLFRGQPFPTDVRDAWRLIREAHERWTGEPMPDVGGHADKIADAEKRLGMTLPPSVREYVAFAHDLLPQEWWGPHSRFVYRERLSMELLPELTVLSILNLFEGDIHWGVRIDDLHHADPPVHRYDLRPDESGSWEHAHFAPSEEPPTAKLSEFVFWQAHTYCDWEVGHAGGMRVELQDMDQARSLLNEQFTFCGQIGTTPYFESGDLSAVLAFTGERGGAAEVRVRPARPLTEADMPDCIREWFRGGAAVNGYFGDLRYGDVPIKRSRAIPVQESAAPHPAIPPTPVEPWSDDIPF